MKKGHGPVGLFPLKFPLNWDPKRHGCEGWTKRIYPVMWKEELIIHLNEDTSYTWGGGRVTAPPSSVSIIWRLHPLRVSCSCICCMCCIRASAACDTHRRGILRLLGSHCSCSSSPSSSWMWWAVQEDEARTWKACWRGTGFWPPPCPQCCSVRVGSRLFAFPVMPSCCLRSLFGIWDLGLNISTSDFDQIQAGMCEGMDKWIHTSTSTVCCRRHKDANRVTFKSEKTDDMCHHSKESYLLNEHKSKNKYVIDDELDRIWARCSTCIVLIAVQLIKSYDIFIQMWSWFSFRSCCGNKSPRPKMISKVSRFRLSKILWFKLPQNELSNVHISPWQQAQFSSSIEICPSLRMFILPEFWKFSRPSFFIWQPKHIKQI